MIRAFSVLGLTVLLLGSGCASRHARHSVQPIVGVTNASLHILADNTRRMPRSGTFDWGVCYFQIPSEFKVDITVLDQRLHDALLEELNKKGFALKKQKPDYLVGYAVAAGDKVNQLSLDAAYGADLVMPPIEPAAAIQYKQGALIVDIVDARKKRLLWRGAITAGIDLNVTEEQKQVRIRAAIAELLRHFPKV